MVRKDKFILSEKTPAFMPEMKRIFSEEERTPAFRPGESIILRENASESRSFQIVVLDKPRTIWCEGKLEQ